MKHLQEEIQRFFCNAMSHGWVNGAKEVEDERWPGYKVIEEVNGPYRLIDAYCVGENSNRSVGHTTIWRKNRYQAWIPVWHMNYQGWYEKRALKFLKGVLRNAYRNEEFHGGRGPTGITMERDGKRLTYVNEITSNEFHHFAGRERVIDNDIMPNGEIHGSMLLGEHEYSGMLLF